MTKMKATEKLTDPLPQCQSPSERGWPQQQLEFQRVIASEGDPSDFVDGIDLQCENARAHVRASVLTVFTQEWTVKRLLIGDHISTISLAPSEVITIEVRRTQRTLLEESRETASTVEEGTERLNSDKESINVGNTSARGANWGISANGGFALNGVGASVGLTQAQTINETATFSVGEVHETTVKSTVKTTTQTKIQVRGVTETTVEARQTRIFRNPYQDRALDLNLYEILKQFHVKTSQDQLLAGC